MGLLLAACLMGFVQTFGEDVCFTENGIIYSSVAPGHCGHYIGRHGRTDVMVRGYEPTLHFEACQTLRVPSTVTHGDTTYSVVLVGENAFVGLNTVEKIIVEDGIEDIGSNAFAFCPSLKSVRLPSTLNGLGYELFYESNSLMEIVIESDDGAWQTAEHCNAITDDCDDGVHLVQGCAGTRIPASVKVIEDDAFAGCHALERIVIPEGVEEIGHCAFAGCKNLREIVLPESLRKIGMDVFRDCTSLTSIRIPRNVDDIGGGNLFCGCHQLTSVVVDKDNATYDSRSRCNGIVRKADSTLVAACRATVITRDIRHLGQGCFSCVPLHTVHIPKTLVSMEESSFSRCNEIDEISVDPKNPFFTSPQGSNALLTKDGRTLVLGCRTTEIPEGVEEIGVYAFAGRYVKDLLGLPASVRRIGMGAFSRCRAMNNVVIPATVTEVGASAFADCEYLHTVQLLAPLEEIKPNTFKGCTNLFSIRIPESVREIGHSAFEGCTSLSNVVLPATAKLDRDVFRNCPFSPSPQVAEK